MPAFVLIRILAPAFFARRDTKSPMTFALINVAVGSAGMLALYNLGLGVPGIAAGTSIGAWANALLLGGALWRRGHYRPSTAATSRLARIVMASAGLAAVVAFASWARPWLQGGVESVLARLGTSHGGKEISVMVVAGLGGLTYVVLAFATKAVTLAEVKGLVRRSK